MRILFAEHKPAQRLGGIEAVCGELATLLERRGHEVIRRDHFSRLDAVDLIHFHGLWSPQHALLAALARRAKTPTVVAPHGMLEPWAMRSKWFKKRPYFWLVEQWKLRHAGAVLVSSELEAASVRHWVPKARVRVVPHGSQFRHEPDYTQARRELDWGAQERVLLFLGRIHPVKGLDLLLKALQRVNIPTNQLWRLVVVGEGASEYTEVCRALARQLEPRVRVDWVGAKWGDERWVYFQGADLFCLPSHSENFGLAVLEALEVGTPVLATSTTPWGEVEDAAVGFVGTPGVASIAGCLERFAACPVASPEQRAAVRAWAYARYHWDNLVDQLVTLYESLLD